MVCDLALDLLWLLRAQEMSRNNVDVVDDLALDLLWLLGFGFECKKFEEYRARDGQILFLIVINIFLIVLWSWTVLGRSVALPLALDMVFF